MKILRTFLQAARKEGQSAIVSPGILSRIHKTGSPIKALNELLRAKIDQRTPRPIIYSMNKAESRVKPGSFLHMSSLFLAPVQPHFVARTPLLVVKDHVGSSFSAVREYKNNMSKDPATGRTLNLSPTSSHSLLHHMYST